MPSKRVTAVSTALFVVATIVVVAAVVPAGGATAPDPGRSTTEQAAQAEAEDTDLNLTIRIGPRVEFEELNSAAAVREHAAAGRLPVRQQFTPGGPFVAEISHAGLAAELGDGNATAAFLDRFGTPAANLTFEGTNHGPNRLPKWIDPFPNGTRAFVDAENDTTYVVVDTDRVEVTYSDAPGPRVDRNVSQPNPEYPPDLTEHDVFRANVTLAGGSNLTAGETAVSAARDFAVRIWTAELSYDDEQRERVYVDSAPDQTIRGATNVPEGLDVTVVLRTDLGSSDPDEWVARRSTATVGENGTFAATFDLSDVPNGTVAKASVRFDDRNVLQRGARDPPERGTVVVTSSTGSVRVLETERNASGSYDAVTVDATVSRGGFVVLHRGTATGPIAGVSGHLSPGEHEEIPVYVGYSTESTDALVAVVHRDGNQNRWFDNATVDRPYGTAGDAVADTGFAPPSPGSPRQPSSTTSTPTPTTDTFTTTATTGAPDGATESPTDDRPAAATDSSATTTTDSSEKTRTDNSTTAATDSSEKTATVEPVSSPETTTAGTGAGFGAVATLLAAILAVGRLRRR